MKIDILPYNETMYLHSLPPGTLFRWNKMLYVKTMHDVGTRDDSLYRAVLNLSDFSIKDISRSAMVKPIGHLELHD